MLFLFIEYNDSSSFNITPGRQRLLKNAKKENIDWEFNQDYSFDNQINSGEKVYHKKFGNGKILSVEGEKALVKFEEFSILIFLPVNFAILSVMGL